ncbi:TPA: endonuclease/exonuclease/phosphatase family protein [Enterococcus faecalis]
MTNLKILEWNINQRSSSKDIPNYVVSEIVRKNPDIIVLVEFKGTKNAKMMEESFSDYYVSYYNGTPYSLDNNRTGNGILIALKKNKFLQPKFKDISYPKVFDEQQPNWFKIHSTLRSGENLDIIGIRVRILKESKKDLQSRKEQIEWILNNNKNLNKQIVLGDFNYGPHRTAYQSELKLNWQDIIDMIRSYGYLKEDISPYSPIGTSWKYANLDWLVTRGVSVDIESDYNELDWSFGRYNKKNYVQGYLVPEGFFIRNDPSYPDHAIFTVEIGL